MAEGIGWRWDGGSDGEEGVEKGWRVHGTLQRGDVGVPAPFFHVVLPALYCLLA